MNQVSLSSLRVRLAMVVVLAVIPSLALIWYNAQGQRAEANTRAREDVERLALLTAQQNTRVIEGTRQMLVTLAQLPDVQGNDSARCQSTLRQLLQQQTLYSNLGVA